MIPDTFNAAKGLIIFIKNPQKGKVKTRLARTVGDEKALEIYFDLVRITRENAQILRGVKCFLFYSDWVEKNDEWDSQIFSKYQQKGHDLGERMCNAFDIVLNECDSACIIGSDCPTLSTDILQISFNNLDTHNYTIGPSTDGGYYLLGLRKGIFYENLFQNIEWSTPSVFPTTLERFEANKGTYALLPTLTDIDEEKDWVAYCLQKETINPI